MDEFTNRIVGRLDVSHRDDYAIARNAAANGRLFAIMLFVANLWSFIDGRGAWHWRLALAAALIVGLAHLAEVLPMPDRQKRFAAALIAALAATVLVLSFVF